ncbi:MAG TPA: DUF4870 domain-containing protein [Steroidobacteraceae bacterium]|nr:DUF4870 domain-containing protein [Steroidobacteraceae bacterium]
MEIGREERNWAMAAHLCGLLWLVGGSGFIFLPFGTLVLFTILGPLIIWRTKGETMPFVAEQAKESLNFQITVFLAALVCAALAVILIGFVLLWILALANLILVIIAAIQVSDGKPYRYPLCLRLVS